MDSTAHISNLIDQLDDDLDNLQEALKTILSKSLTEVASSYPVLDRAKLYILVTYALESAIFSFLRLTGTSAREHPVYRELERVKQYFQKAKLAETTGSTIANGTPIGKPGLRLDQAAAGRFIKAALASNEIAASREKATKKAVKLDPVEDAPKDAKLGHVEEAPKAVVPSKKRKADAIEPEVPVVPPEHGSAESDEDSSDDDDDEQESSPEGENIPIAAKTNGTIAATPANPIDPRDDGSKTSAADKAATKKARKQRQKEAKSKRKQAVKEAAAASKERTQLKKAATSTDSGPATKKQKKNKAAKNPDTIPVAESSKKKKKGKGKANDKGSQHP